MSTDDVTIPFDEYVIRRFRKDDIDALVRHANNRKVWLNLRDVFPHPYERQHAREWLETVRSMDPELAFAIADAQELIGGIGLHPQTDVLRRSAELGYWLGEPYWGKGIATRAVRAMTEWGFANLDVNRIFAYVFGWNASSARVLEKAGFIFEGRMRQAVYKDGQLTDMLVYGRLRGENPATPGRS
jgi:RimJ/RimL family protein N-acetyltransferase